MLNTLRLYPRLRPFWSAIAALASIPLITPATHAMFQRLQTETAISCHHKLTRIQNIPYQCWEFHDPDAKLPVWKQSLGFQFGKLTYAQWETIAIAYSSWRATPTTAVLAQLPPYNPNHDYWLIDFMPPLMQAINRHRFMGQSHQGYDQNKVSILTNCWGTLYELLRLKNAKPKTPTYLMMVDATTMLNTLKALSTQVASPQPGDFLLISHRHPSSSETPQEQARLAKTYLDHGALFIDHDLLFEKAGAGDRVPYRLIGLSTLQRIWRQDVFEHQIYRPTDQPMPHPLIFQGDRTSSITQPSPDAEEEYAIFSLPPLVESGGRSALPPEVYTPDYYKFRDTRGFHQGTLE